MNILLKSWKVKKLSLEAVNEKRNRNIFRFSCGNELSETDEKEFFIGFKMTLKGSGFNIEIEMHFSFEADEALNDDFKNSPFMKINAPAIAFPYLRAYISNVTLQSGYDAVVIPSVNFVKIAEQNQS